MDKLITVVDSTFLACLVVGIAGVFILFSPFILLHKMLVWIDKKVDAQ